MWAKETREPGSLLASFFPLIFPAYDLTLSPSSLNAVLYYLIAWTRLCEVMSVLPWDRAVLTYLVLPILSIFTGLQSKKDFPVKKSMHNAYLREFGN